MENTEKQTALSLQEKPEVSNYFGNKESFEHVQRVAVMFSKSDLVPKRYQGNVGNCIIALEMAGRIGGSPLLVMQNLDVIQGKPGWSSTFLIASINACGKFSPLRYEEDAEDGGRTRAWALDKFNGNEKLLGAWVSMNMAKAEGWVDKNGSKWKTMPELMRRYRAASFFCRQFAPEVSMGMQSTEEILDITPMQNATVTFEDLKELFEGKFNEGIVLVDDGAFLLAITDCTAFTETEKKDFYRIINTKEVNSYKKLQTLLTSK